MFKRMLSTSAVVAMLCVNSAPAPAMELAPELAMVYGAASTQPVIDALIAPMEERGLGIAAVYAGSATLARQIELGAPDVDVFISANTQWMDYLDFLGLLEPGTRRAVATNRLVVIAAPGTPVPSGAEIKTGDAIVRVLDGGRLAIAGPGSVPAGIYGREALKHIGAWDGLKDQLAPTKDVTGALMLVARGEARLGVVYQSDAQRVENVRIFGTFPAASHSPIVYQAALLKGRASAGLLGFLDVLTGPEGQAAFRAAGFGPQPKLGPQP